MKETGNGSAVATVMVSNAEFRKELGLGRPTYERLQKEGLIPKAIAGNIHREIGLEHFRRSIASRI